MKDVSQELDPDTQKQMEKFRKVGPQRERGGLLVSVCAVRLKSGFFLIQEKSQKVFSDVAACFAQCLCAVLRFRLRCAGQRAALTS